MRGKVRVTEHYSTKGGRLPCFYILHAVGPYWNGGTDVYKHVSTLNSNVLTFSRIGSFGEEEKVYDTVRNCLKKTDEMNLSSIALPAISAGLFRVPPELSCKNIIEAVRF